MSEAKRLLEQATPLPWDGHGDEFIGRGGGRIGLVARAYGNTEDEVLANASLIVYAVNHLPDYEAAVDLLEIVLPWVAPPSGGLTYNAHEKAIALLAHLREGVPA